ncbi:MAG: tRNA threonylcarbamoyladenosine dehydratase [Clostridia bacterium]|nr:tRNA threonylcarbamoyladenosine dehydratase [Clostridia bacterium]
MFDRGLALIGKDGLARLAAASIAVCGLGGVGSYIAEVLARSGIGTLLLIDADTIAPSNINRQLCALHSTLGRPKAEIMAERIADINPACRVEARRIMLTPGDDYASLFSGTDYIADAIDDLPAKIALIRYAHTRPIPLISAMGAGRRLDPTALAVADIAQTYGCPLARRLRKSLREQGIEQGVQVVFSSEPPRELREGKLGSMIFVPAAMGLLMASVIVRYLLADLGAE